MDFFAEQRRAAAQTRRLVWLFALAVAVIVGAVAVITGFAVAGFGGVSAPAPGLPMQAAPLGEVLPVAIAAGLAALGLVLIASWIKSSRLRAGGGVVAQQLGGTLIPPDTTNPSYRRLRNVVEEMAIASGVPVPEIYVLEQESGINAFAAGYTPADAAIGVTRGCLEHLGRAELQGVIAHEFSHILNGDMRLNIRLMGMLFGILVLSILARNVLHFSRAGRNNRGAAPILLAALLVMLIGSIGVFFGRLIKAGVSRQREYLADASAVQFTRDNAAVAGALKKIAVVADGSRITAADAEEVSHMLFGDGVGYSRLFATHPPLMARIQRLDPGFGPEQLDELTRQWHNRRRAQQEREEAAELDNARQRFPGGLGGLPGSEALPGGVLGGVLAGTVLAGGAAAGKTADASGSSRGSAPAAARFVASPGLDQIRYAGLLRAELPPVLAHAAHMHDDARELVLAVLVDASSGEGGRHLDLIGRTLGEDSRQAVEALLPAFSGLHPVQRAPLLAIAFPALKRRPRAELDAFIALVDALTHIDGEVSVFEYALGRELRAHLAEAADPAGARAFGSERLGRLQAEAASVLAILAMHGNGLPEQARRAYLSGLNQLLPQAVIPFDPPTDWVAALDRVLPRLDRLEPLAKAMLLDALLVTLHHDRLITAEETEILRAICASLHCPMPPLVPQEADG
jgi:Zn-dependent protease with chaperone function